LLRKWYKKKPKDSFGCLMAISSRKHGGFEPKRSCEMANATALREKASAGRAGEREGGLEARNRMLRAGRRIPLAP
jgi:hypothetical protein